MGRSSAPHLISASVFALAALLNACASQGASAPAQSVAVGDARAGLAYARERCATCHAVAPRQTSPNPAAPSFEAVANTPGMTRTALNAWLHSPHPTMPQLIVEHERIDDLSAYLLTLRQP